MAIQGYQQSDGPGRIGAWGVVGVVIVSMLCAVMAFAWSIEHHPEAGSAAPVSRHIGFGDPDPGWANKARALLVAGRYEELIESAQARRRNWGYDPEGWLFAGFAYEALAEQPGFGAIWARVHAERVWEDLLLRTEPWREYAGPDGMVDWEALEDSGKTPTGRFAQPYYAGWALAGLGRHVEARERFGRFADSFSFPIGRGGDHYNQACYRALSGDDNRALMEWALAVERSPMNLGWAGVDPDLVSLHGDPMFDWMLRFAQTRGRLGRSGTRAFFVVD